MVATGSVLNDGGRIYVGGEIALNTPRIDNTGGLLSVGTMAITGERFSNAGGTLNVSRAFSADVGRFDNTGGTLRAGDLLIRTAGDLVNRDGTLTGNGAVELAAGGTLDNTAGTVVGNDAAHVAVGVIANQGGKIHAAGTANLTVSAVALLDNRNRGEIGAGGNNKISAGTLDNDAGRITAVGDLRVTTLGAASNRAGTLAANRNVTLDAAGISNDSGTVNAVDGDLAVTTAGATVNRSGKLQASGAVVLTNGGLDNTDGQVIGARAAIDTRGNALTNVRGTLAGTATTVDIQSGALNNTSGLIQSTAALTIDTHGQALTNTHAAGYADGEGGITSAGAMTLRTGAVDNRAGFVGAAGALKASTDEFVNREDGMVVSRATADIDTRGARYDNRGGQTLSRGDLTISAGRIDNEAGLIRSTETATLRASIVDNANTLGTDQGIEARNLSLTAGSLTNTLGAIRADADATILSAGTVDNSAGLISAKGALQIADPQAGTATPKTLGIVNTGGTLTAGKRLALDAAGFSGDGTVVSDKDLSIALSQNVINNGAVSAAGTLSYVTTGTFTNNSKLYATQTLTVGGSDVLNNVTGEMGAGQKTAVTASGTLTNRGLIDGVDTQVNAGTLDNLGTGRIYGDRISLLATGTLNNGAETVNGVTSAASIAARDTLHIGAKVINNSGHAQIFSVGDAAIGEALDGNRLAIGQATTLTNSAATIDIGGNLRLAADQVHNLNPTIRTEQVAGPTQHFLEYAPLGANYRLSGGTYDRRSTHKDQEFAYYTTADGQRIQANQWYIWDYDRNTAITQVVAGSSDPGQIFVGGNLDYSGALLRNQASKIVIGGTLTGNTGALKNEGLDGVETTTDKGKVIHSYTEKRYYSGLKKRDRRFERESGYDVAQPDRTFTLNEFTYEQGLKPVSGQGPDGLVLGNVAANTASAGQVNGGNRAGVITEVATGVDGIVRSSQAGNGGVPTASLFRTTSGGHYLVETDPRFAGYRNWLSSDYLLNALGQDPNNILKRLGDGFYEQKLIREQIAQLTGYRYLDGFASDEDQYTALMNAGATFAQAYGLRPGIGLSAAQMAQLTSDIVWLVEQTVTLADGSTQRVLVPQVYVRLKPGDIDGGGALLSANALHITTAPGAGNVTNTGTLAGRSLVSITADNIDNLGGRIVGGSVGLNARNDLNNIGGSIEARNAAVLTAGRDINIRTTTSSQTGAQGSRTGIDRVAGVYVTNPGGTLIASAGNDVNLVGAILSNTEANSYTQVHAGRDINLGTVTTSSTQDTTWNARNYRRSAESQEIGSQIIGGSGAGSSVMLDADRNIVARQAAVQTEGLLSVYADGNIDIQAGRRTQSVDEAHQNTARSGLSKRTTTSHDTLDESISQGSCFQGGITAITADGNIVGEGVRISGTDGVLVQAGGTLDLHEARDVRMEGHEVAVKKSGFGLGGGSIPMVVPKKNASRDASTTYSNTAAVTTIESSNGGVLLKGDQRVALRGVQIDAAKDITVKGGSVSITGAVNESATTSEHYQKSLNLGTETWWRDPGTGINAQRTNTNERQETSLVRSTLDGANVTISATGVNGEGGVLALAGTSINTPGKLTLEADKLVLGTQTTQVDQSHTSQGRDLMWQKAQGEGTSDQTTHYNQFNAGQLATHVNSVQAGLGARDSIQSLAQQPGMGWVNQINNDPKLAGKVDWVKVEEAHTNWDYKQQGLTPEGAAIVTLVAAYFTAGAASGLGASAGTAVGGGMTGTVVSGAVTAGVTALASQVAVATINNRGNLGDTLQDLGSSENVKGLLTAIATGGVLAGLNLNPTGQPTVGGGAQGFMNQLGQNLQAGAAKAVIGTAINGGSFEENLKQGLKSAFIDTLAAQGANQIGDWTKAGALNDVTNKIAHAIAGCAIGAAKADSASGCGAGALGATMGELSAELHGRNIDTVQFASMMGGIAAAIAGGDAAAINLASQTAANAAANNYLSHDEKATRNKALADCYSGSTAACTELARLNNLDAQRDLRIKTLADNCTVECAQVVKFINDELMALGCISGPYACDDATLRRAWMIAQPKAQALQPGFGPDDAIFLAYGLARGGLKIVSAIANSGKEVPIIVGDALSSTPTSMARQINNLYRDGAPPDLVRQAISQAARSSTHNADASEVILGKYVAGSVESYEAVAQSRGATYFRCQTGVSFKVKWARNRCGALIKLS